jgi:transposase
MHLIACDISKATLDAAWYDEHHQRWFECSKLPNTRRGWRRLLNWAEKYCGCVATEIQLVVEATGVYHRPLADFAYTYGLKVIVVNPGRAAENARSHNRLNKNDRLDARGLQCFGRELIKAHQYVPDSPEIQALRALLSRLRQLDVDQQREQNRLEKCPYIAQSRGLSASIRRQSKSLAKEKTRIQQDIDQLIRTHEPLQHLQQLMRTIKGIGPISSQWLLPLLYRQQFNSARQLAAFLGLTPIHKTSGTSLRKKPQLSGRGNGYVRSRLYMPAVCAITNDPAMKAFYETLIKRGKTPKQAITAVMRKLVHICYGVVKNDQPYRCPITA